MGRDNINSVYLPVEDVMIDVMGDEWTMGEGPMNLRDILKRTVRGCTVKNGEDAERTYDLLKAVTASANGSIELGKSDYHWMIKHFKETAHQLWKAPDSAYLIHYLQDHVTDEEPAEVESLD